MTFWLSLPVHSGSLKRIDYPKRICLAHALSFECFHCSLLKHAHVIYCDFSGCKKDNLQMKNCGVFLIFAQNIDCGYTLELRNLCFRAKIRKNVYPCKPQFYYIKVGCKGVYITRTCYPDVLKELIFMFYLSL